MTKSKLESIKNLLVSNKSLFIGDDVYKLDKEDIIGLYKELAFSMEEYIEENKNFNTEKSSKEIVNFVEKRYMKNLEDFSFSYLNDEE